MKKVIFVLIMNFLIFCTLLVTIELLGQAYYRWKTGRFVFEDPPSFYGNLFELHPYLAGRLKKNTVVESYGKRITIVGDNTRWTGRPEDDSGLVRVAALGGSTTFGTGVTDSDTWPALLQVKLGRRFSVTNFGVPGYSTVEAIIQMALVVPETKPDFAIVYQGWNDIRNYHEVELGPDYYCHGVRQYGNLSIRVAADRSVLDKFRDVSATVQLATNIKSTFLGHSRLQSYETLGAPDPFVDRMYMRNLKTLKALSENLCCYTIFVPQVLNWQNYCDPVGWSRHIENTAMPRLMQNFNLLMQSVCSDDDTGCMFLERAMTEKWNSDDFVDNGHFSRKGGEKFAEMIAEVIVQKTREDNRFQNLGQ